MTCRQPLHVAVVSPHDVARAGLTQMLHATGRVRVVHVAHAEELPVVDIDAGVVDLAGLTTTAGMALAESLAAATPVVGIARSERVDLDERATRLGVLHILPEDVSRATLWKAVEQVARRRRHRREHELSVLTEREYDVLRLLAGGRSNDEIARELFLSGNTVRGYVRSAYRKIGVNSRTGAVLWAVRNHLLPPAS